MTWWKIAIPYDTNPANDTFNRDTERSVIVGPSGTLNKNAAEVNVVIVKAHDSAGHRAFTPFQKAPVSYAQTSAYQFGMSSGAPTFLHDVVHEIGHQLDLSTRHGTPAIANENHDLGVFQSIIVQGKPVTALGLMYPKFVEYLAPGVSKEMSTFWLRHEDWERASLITEDKTLPWSYDPPPPRP